MPRLFYFVEKPYIANKFLEMKKYVVVSLYSGRLCLDTSNQPQKEPFDNEADAGMYKQELYEKWETSGETYDPVYCVICLNLGK